jgi:hypothetical protein
MKIALTLTLSQRERGFSEELLQNKPLAACPSRGWTGIRQR